MAKLVVNQDKIGNIEELVKICPFGALENHNGVLEISGACKMCRLCVKKGPKGAVEYVEEEVKQIDKSLWSGIGIYVDHVDGEIHPVTYELIGKARELAEKVRLTAFLGKGNNFKIALVTIPSVPSDPIIKSFNEYPELFLTTLPPKFTTSPFGSTTSNPLI